jgi:LuxR family maltose regulon positive regulatory protein
MRLWCSPANPALQLTHAVRCFSWNIGSHRHGQTHQRVRTAGSGEVETAAAPSPPSTPSPVEPLTGRELGVLHLLGEGCSNREIAEALVITLNGVRKHTSNIYGKLGVHSRTQAVVRAQELGLL